MYVLPNARAWAKVGDEVAVIDSTNRELQRRLRAGPLPEGYGLRADFQTAGRGRLDRDWEGAPAANLYVSYALAGAGFTPERLFAASQLAALAVCDAVEAVAPRVDCAVKWPNDIYVADRKLAGILIESTLVGGRVGYLIVGVGANVNQRDLPARFRATSLAAETDLEYAPAALARAVATALQREVGALRAAHAAGDTHTLHQRYHERLRGLGALARYELTGTSGARPDNDAPRDIVATLRGVVPDGRARLETPAGEERLYDMDAVRFRGFVERVA